MKKEYELPEIEIIEFEQADIVTVSPGGGHTGNPDCLVDL